MAKHAWRLAIAGLRGRRRAPSGRRRGRSLAILLRPFGFLAGIAPRRQGKEEARGRAKAQAPRRQAKARSRQTPRQRAPGKRIASRQIAASGNRGVAVSVVQKVHFPYIQSNVRLMLSSILSRNCNISCVFLTLSSSFLSAVLLCTSLTIRKSFGNFDCTKKAPPLPFAWTEPKCLWSGPASPAAAALAQCPWRRVADNPARSRLNAG